jgi:hypothetical protein
LDVSNGAEVFLISANDGIESAMIEGRLRSVQIPYFIKSKETGSYMKVLMGYSVFGVDILVPSNLLSKARAILQIEDKSTNNNASLLEIEELHQDALENYSEFQSSDQERDDYLDEDKHRSMRFNAMVLLSVIFSPVITIALICWLLWKGILKFVKYINKL